MPRGFYNADQVLAQIFADRDSEGDDLPPDDDRSAESSDSDTAAAPSVTQAAHTDHGEGRQRGGNQGCFYPKLKKKV